MQADVSRDMFLYHDDHSNRINTIQGSILITLIDPDALLRARNLRGTDVITVHLIPELRSGSVSILEYRMLFSMMFVVHVCILECTALTT